MYLLLFLNYVRHHFASSRGIVQFSLQILAIQIALRGNTFAHFFDMVILK